MKWNLIINNILEKEQRPLTISEIYEGVNKLDNNIVTFPEGLTKYEKASIRVMICLFKRQGALLHTIHKGVGGFYYLPAWEVTEGKINNRSLNQLKRKYE